MKKSRIIKKSHKYSHIPLRLNILFSIIVLAFGLLIFRLVDLQIVNSANFQAKLTQTRTIEVSQDVERGQILDRNGEVLAGNKVYTTINYTRKTTDASKMLVIAENLSQLIKMDISALKERDLKDYFIAKNLDTVNKRLDATEKKQTGSTLYETQLSKVTAEDINYTDNEKQIIAIYTKMNSVSWLNTVMIKNRNVTEQEVANVTEKSAYLDGVSIGSDWERIYPQGTVLRDLLGNVTTSTIGVPSDKSNLYLAKGYALNSRVGNSYLEQQYDDVLRGTPKKTLFQLDVNYNIEKQEGSYSGKIGNNVYLSIDLNLQKKVENILTNFLTNRNQNGLGDLNYSAYAVVQDVNTGELLAVSGKKLGYDSTTDQYTNKIEDDVLGAINGTFTMGSVVKAATLGIAYEYGVITENNNNTLVDTPLYFGNSKESISSDFNPKGSVDLTEEMALARSSNVYMSRLAMMIGGQKNFNNGDKLSISNDTLSKMRKSYAMYGLGGNTGIDLPTASRGYSPETTALSNALFLSFGQYDTYSPLQVSQYISTIANGGIRYAPRLGKEIRTSSGANTIGQTETELTSTVMNKINVTSSQMKRIQNGLFAVTHSAQGTAYAYFNNFYPQVSAKTGTAEAFYGGVIKSKQGVAVRNAINAAYFPSDNPQISVTVVIPYLEKNTGLANAVAKSIISAYNYK